MDSFTNNYRKSFLKSFEDSLKKSSTEFLRNFSRATFRYALMFFRRLFQKFFQQAMFSGNRTSTFHELHQRFPREFLQRLEMSAEIFPGNTTGIHSKNPAKTPTGILPLVRSVKLAGIPP